MHIEAIQHLAMTLRSSPRLMACVLGSGVSRAAGVPTGWEVVVDLIERQARLFGANVTDDFDAAGWYFDRWKKEPDYSDLVEAFAPASSVRRNLLENYFTVLDPATDARVEHEPTAAHRAIARLVNLGLIRVIITTNFDRLMEHALRDAGVGKVEVVSSETEAQACYPFHASEAFLFKLHGDWKDLDLRNSRTELTSYPTPLEALLRRILDEHGLIVCGWSAEYDVALRDAIIRYNRRFPVYWVDPRPKEQASKLCASLKAWQVPATADQFFVELEGAATVLGRGTPRRRLTAEVLLLRARRAIEKGSWTTVDTLVSEATDDLVAWIDARQHAKPDTPESQDQQNDEVESISEPLCRLAALVAHYNGNDWPIRNALSRLLAAAQGRQEWGKFTDPIASYPAVLLAFTWSIMRASRVGWREPIVSLRDVGSGRRGAELAFPPGSNRRLAPYRSSKYAGNYKNSPQEFWGNRVSDAVYGYCHEWLPRRNEFDDLYDRLDVVVAARSTRLGTLWIPPPVSG